MGNLQSEEEITNVNTPEVEIKNVDENNPPNPQQFYVNKVMFNNKKVSDIISQFCKLNQQELGPYERSKTSNEINVKEKKNNENEDINKEKGIKSENNCKNDIFIPKILKNSKTKIDEEKKIEEKGKIILKKMEKEESIHLDENEATEENTKTSPIISTFHSINNFQDKNTIKNNNNNSIDNNNTTNYNSNLNQKIDINKIPKEINSNQKEKIEKTKTNSNLIIKTEKESESDHIINMNKINQEKIVSPRRKSSPQKLSTKRLDSVLLERPIETTAGSLIQDIRKIYKFKEVLGGGHFGTVRVAYKRKEEPRRYYAIKSISKKNLSPSDLEDLIKEVDIISALDHPVIIDFYETYQDEFFFHIVMELCKGKEVFQKIASEGKIEEKKVAIVIHKVLNAIAYCHSRGITHRDIKPENILFETDELNSEIKLIDFGLSRKYSADQKMHTILGTPYYIAPEVLKGNYDEKCDIWSIGALTYIMLCGEPPFKGKSNNEIFMKIIKEPIKFNPYKWNNLSENSKNFIKNLLNKDPNKRPTAMEALGHSWFNSIEISSPKNITQDILNNIKNFRIKQQFKKIVLRYLLSTLNESELKKYKRAFYAIDFKHNGTISKEELIKAFEIGKIEITNENIDFVFKLCDENRKGSLDYTDFLMCAYDKNYLLTEKKLELAFQYFDVDNSGIIEIHDVKDAMLRFGKNVVDSDDTKKLIMEITKDENVESIELQKFIEMFKG